MATEGVKYIGSKNTITPHIVEAIEGLSNVKSVCDIFTGTTRVAQSLKQAGYSVITNDMASYSEVFANCYIVNDQERDLTDKLDYLNALPGKKGWFTQHYAGGATNAKGDKCPIMFFQEHNTKKLDVIRDEIDNISTGVERDILLTSLILALDRVDNTVGVQQAFLKNKWSARSAKEMSLVLPALIIDKRQHYKAYQMDANVLAPQLDVDLVYIDPPYTNHSYYHYYHIWETIVRNDKPEVYGVPNKRKDAQNVKSDYNYKRKALQAFDDLLSKLKCPYSLISYNDEGIIVPEDMMNMLTKYGKVSIKKIDYKRNVMCDIGRHNNLGQRVSKKSKDKNVEFLYLLSK